MLLTRMDKDTDEANSGSGIKKERDPIIIDTNAIFQNNSIASEASHIDESQNLLVAPLIQERPCLIPTIKKEQASENDIIKNRCDFLSSMFPNIDLEYIQSISSNPLLNGNEGNVLELLIEHLLTHKDGIENHSINTSTSIKSEASINVEMDGTSNDSVEFLSTIDESNRAPKITEEIVLDDNVTSGDSSIIEVDDEVEVEESHNDAILDLTQEDSDFIPPIKKKKVEEDSIIKHRYNTLSSIFPDYDDNYLQEISAKPPFESSEGNVLSRLIDHLLTYKNQISKPLPMQYTAENIDLSDIDDDTLTDPIENVQEASETVNDQILSEMLFKEELAEREHERLQNEKLLSEFLQKEDKVVDDKMKILVNILPDACPETLRRFVEQNRESSDSLEELVDNFLSNKNYEKRDQYFAKLKLQKNIEQCITHFNVEEFLNKFPEPFEYFEDDDRSCAYSELAVNFLQNKYKYYNIDYIKNVYISKKHNLTLADKDLRRENVPDTLTHTDLNKINDASLLQEIAFIQNRSLLKNYLDTLQEAEKNEMEILRVQELLLECQCCFDECKPLDTIECENNHVFCRKCVVRGTKMATTNQQSSIKCFAGCNVEIPLRLLQRVLPGHTFDAFFKKRQEQELMDAELEGLESCPHCLYSMELAPEIKIFTCNNPECMKITCRLCKKPNHLPVKCEDVLDADKARMKIEESMSTALIRRCWKCQRPFVKSTGCNHMTCVCGAQSCYICQKPYNRGQYNHARCHQESRTYEQQQVERNRQQTTAQIQQDFPDLNIPKI